METKALVVTVLVIDTIDVIVIVRLYCVFYFGISIVMFPIVVICVSTVTRDIDHENNKWRVNMKRKGII